MRAITKNIVGVARLLAWWLPFAAAFVVSTQATIAQVMAIDPVTGELKDEALFDSIVPLTYASALLITVSWIVLYGIITKTTKEHVPNAQ